MSSTWWRDTEPGCGAGGSSEVANILEMGARRGATKRLSRLDAGGSGPLAIRAIPKQTGRRGGLAPTIGAPSASMNEPAYLELAAARGLPLASLDAGTAPRRQAEGVAILGVWPTLKIISSGKAEFQFIFQTDSWSDLQTGTRA